MSPSLLAYIFAFSETTISRRNMVLKSLLFIVLDDLRPQLSTYGHGTPSATPNIDALGREGLIFQRSFTNYPYCSPSRNSFMSGEWVPRLCFCSIHRARGSPNLQAGARIPQKCGTS